MGAAFWLEEEEEEKERKEESLKKRAAMVITTIGVYQSRRFEMESLLFIAPP